MELVGKDFCKYLLKTKNMKEGVDFKITQKKKSFFSRNTSRVRYKIGGISDVYLYQNDYDKKDIEHLLAASHEASHLINFRKEERRFKRLMKKQDFSFYFFGLTILHIIISFPNIFWKPNLLEISLILVPILFTLNIVGLVSVFQLTKEYKTDESLDEITHRELVDSYLQDALMSVNDCRKKQDLEEEIDKEFQARQSGIGFNTMVRGGI